MGDMKVIGAEESVPKIVLRDLKATDVWGMVRILSKLGLRNFRQSIDKNVLKAMSWNPPTAMNEKGETIPLPREKWTERQEEMALQYDLAKDELLWGILELLMTNIGSCEQDVNKLLADGTGQTVAEIQNMDANDYVELISLYVSREGFHDFFMQAWNLISGASISKKSFGTAMATLMR